MTPNIVTRKLRAILSADAKDYSRLMRSDEEATVNTLTHYRSMIIELVSKYQGRVVDSPGDNILAEFSSVVHAVQCGFEIQDSLQTEMPNCLKTAGWNSELASTLETSSRKGKGFTATVSM